MANLKNPIFRKIEYYLYNYDYIDVKIENINFDADVSDYNQSYYKYIKNKSSSLEDQVIRNIEIEQRIYKLNKWKSIINSVLKKYKETDILKYNFIDLKYFRKVHPITIQKELGLSKRAKRYTSWNIAVYLFSCNKKRDFEGGKLVLIKFLEGRSCCKFIKK